MKITIDKNLSFAETMERIAKEFDRMADKSRSVAIIQKNQRQARYYDGHKSGLESAAAFLRLIEQDDAS